MRDELVIRIIACHDASDKLVKATEASKGEAAADATEAQLLSIRAYMHVIEGFPMTEREVRYVTVTCCSLRAVHQSNSTSVPHLPKLRARRDAFCTFLLRIHKRFRLEFKRTTGDLGKPRWRSAHGRLQPQPGAVVIALRRSRAHAGRVCEDDGRKM